MTRQLFEVISVDPKFGPVRLRVSCRWARQHSRVVSDYGRAAAVAAVFLLCCRLICERPAAAHPSLRSGANR